MSTGRSYPGVHIHSHALVEGGEIGQGTRIWAFAHLVEGCVIGRDCNICDHTFVEGGVQLGDRVTVKSGIYLWDGVTCESDVFLGPNVVFTNDLFPRSRRTPERFVSTIVRRGASIGANATIRAGLTVGGYSMIGCGSVVTRDVPDFGLAYGNPARLHGYVSRAGEKLSLSLDNERAACPATGEIYVLEDGVCRLTEDEETR